MLELDISMTFKLYFLVASVSNEKENHGFFQKLKQKNLHNTVELAPRIEVFDLILLIFTSYHPTPRKPKTLGLLGFGFLGFLTARIEVFDLILLIFTSYHLIEVSFLARIDVFYLILLIFTSYHLIE